MFDQSVYKVIDFISWLLVFLIYLLIFTGLASVVNLPPLLRSPKDMPLSRTILAHNLILRSPFLFFSLYPNLPQNFLPFGKDVPLSQVLHFSRKCSHRCEYQAPIASGHGGVAWGSIPSVLIDCLFWGAFSRLDLENIQSLWEGRKKIPSSCLVSVHGA